MALIRHVVGRELKYISRHEAVAVMDSSKIATELSIDRSTFNPADITRYNIPRQSNKSRPGVG